MANDIRVIIGGVDISNYIAYNGLKRSRNDIDSPNAGRTLDGEMKRGRVATKLRWDITCRPLKRAELSAIESVIMNEYFEATVENDPYYGIWSARCYSNNTNAEFLIKKKNGDEYWSGVTFPLIEV